MSIPPEAADEPVVLLVDDQADVRFMLSLFLDDEGMRHDEAASGEEALERIASRDYALVLLDQRMPPGLSGIEVAERLHASGGQVPIVLYSAFLDPNVEERAAALGLRTVDKGEPDRLMEAVRQSLQYVPPSLRWSQVTRRVSSNSMATRLGAWPSRPRGRPRRRCSATGSRRRAP